MGLDKMPDNTRSPELADAKRKEHEVRIRGSGSQRKMPPKLKWTLIVMIVVFILLLVTGTLLESLRWLGDIGRWIDARFFSL